MPKQTAKKKKAVPKKTPKKKGAPLNNEFWKLRLTHGREKIFSTPEDLWSEAVNYFAWCDNNPLKEQKVFGTGLRMTVDLKRPYTISGLCFFLGIHENTFRNYGNNADYKDYLEVKSAIDQIMYTQKFEGAAVGLFNANIISRDLGLSEKIESKNINYNSDLSEEDLDKKIAELNSKLK